MDENPEVVLVFVCTEVVDGDSFGGHYISGRDEGRDREKTVGAGDWSSFLKMSKEFSHVVYTWGKYLTL